MKQIDAIINNPKESWKERLLHAFEEAGKKKQQYKVSIEFCNLYFPLPNQYFDNIQRSG